MMKALHAVCIAGALLGAASGHAAEERISHGLFDEVTLYRPAGEPNGFVLFLSGKQGWDARSTALARGLANRGAMVAGIDTPRLLDTLEHRPDSCVFPDGDLENLSHYLQGYARLGAYHTPLLAGDSAGASLAYTIQAQAAPDIFAGLVTLDFCPTLALEKPLCRGNGEHFHRVRRAPGVQLLPARKRQEWTAVQDSNAQPCGANPPGPFIAAVPGAKLVRMPPGADWQAPLGEAYQRMATARATQLQAPPQSLADLPLVELKATAPPVDARLAGTFAVLLSGDGGWAGIDKELAAALAAKGVPVVGLDSLRYFWSKRTPEGLAADLDRVVRYYAAQWQRGRVLLLGYSQGANVLPAAVNRLPAATRAMLGQTVLMGLERNAAWEFHVGNWLSSPADVVPILPEARKLQAGTTLCLYGAEEQGSLCPELPAGSVTARKLPGGHHFDGAYEELAALILARLAAP